MSYGLRRLNRDIVIRKNGIMECSSAFSEALADLQNPQSYLTKSSDATNNFRILKRLGCEGVCSGGLTKRAVSLFVSGACPSSSRRCCSGIANHRGRFFEKLSQFPVGKLKGIFQMVFPPEFRHSEAVLHPLSSF